MENAIRFAKKYYFWPVCLIALGLALFFWSSSLGELDKNFTSNESNYLQSKSSVDNIPSNPPNEKMIKAVERKKNNLMQNVYNAWETLYNQQNEHNQWPEIVINNRTIDFNGDISGNDKEPFREQYLYRIVEEFKRMVDTLDLVSERDKNGIAIDDEIGRVNMGGAATPELPDDVSQSEKETTAAADKKELVVWEEKAIDEIIKKHFTFGRTPTPLRIRVAQEDFWIFKNIVDAIKTLNEGAEKRSDASLKEIRSLLITEEAIDQFQARQEKGFFDEKSFTKPGEGGEGEQMEGAESTDSGVDASAGGEGADSLKREYRELYDMRYVDKNGRGLSAIQYYSSISYDSAGINVNKTRNVPVYMSLVIKQNRLSDLMSALTNAEKPVDIKLVLINPGQGWTPSFDFSQFEEGNAEEGDSSMNEGAPRGRIARSSRRGAVANNERSHSQGNQLKINSDEIVVDIYGMVSLFNAPTMDVFPGLSEKLKGTAEGSEDGLENPEDAEGQEDSSNVEE